MTRRKRSGVRIVPLAAVTFGLFLIVVRSGLADDPAQASGLRKLWSRLGE